MVAKVIKKATGPKTVKRATTPSTKKTSKVTKKPVIAKKKPAALASKPKITKDLAPAKEKKAPKATPKKAATPKKVSTAPAKKPAPLKKSVTKASATPTKKSTSSAVKKITTVKKTEGTKRLVEEPKKIAPKKVISTKKASQPIPLAPKKVVKSAAPKIKRVTNQTGSEQNNVDAQADIALAERPISTAQTLLSYGVEPYPLKTGEPYMSDKQKKHFEHLLSAWLSALLQGGDATISDLQESSETPADLSDQASKEEEFALKLRKRDRERKLIKKIEDSLQKLQSEDYGYCDECGIEIGVRRLEARPTATLCIDCKTIAEIKEKQQRV